MKKFLKKLIACTFAAVTCFSVAACGGREDGGEKKDESKIQLYVNNFFGGYGSDWLYGYGDGEDHVKAAKERFQDMYADYEDPVNFKGKKGVQVMINDEKTSIMGKADTILGNDDEIYFAEYAFYYTLLQKDIMLDITDVVAPTAGNKYSANLNSATVENKTIESKFTAEQKDFYGVKTTPTSTPVYYGIPHYSGYTGLTYNVDLFNEMGAYFVDVPYENSECSAPTYVANVPFSYEHYVNEYGNLEYNQYYQLFQYNAEDFDTQHPELGSAATLTAGPDGQYGNEDDGLPRTFDEFYILCHFLNEQGENPVAWAGAQIGDYVTYLVNALAVEFEGLDQAKLAYTFNGTATTLGRLDNNGNWVADAQPTVISESETAGNGYELMRQRGKYEALKFLQNLLFGKGKVKANGNGHDWVSNSSFVSTTSHMNQQDNFLDKTTEFRACMLVEGAWWESEATNTFIRMGTGNGKMDRNFSFMALPNANAEEYKKKVDGDKNTTLFDHIYSLAFIKKNINPHKINIAKDFLRFVYSDPQLIQYTQITNTPKALNYTMTENDLRNCSTYGKSLMRMKQTSEVLYPYSQHDFYMANQGSLAALSMYMSEIDGLNKNYPCAYFWEDGITAEQYFTGLYDYEENRWQSLRDNAYMPEAN